MLNVGIEKITYALGEVLETNEQLKQENPGWKATEIFEKVGVKQRYIAPEDTTAADLAVTAAEKIFSDGVSRDEIDFVVLITQSPDYFLPTTACIIQDRLGLPKRCLAFDVNLGCSGFVYGMGIVAPMIASGLVKKGLLICADTYSKFIATDDRICKPIFSDGAAAVLVAASDIAQIGPFEFGSDGSGGQHLIVKAGGARYGCPQDEAATLFMDGSKVFMFTMSVIPKMIHQLLEKSGFDKGDIDLFVFHQASKMVLDNISRKLDLPPEKCFSNIGEIGNTVSATIPIALQDACDQGVLKRGDRVLIAGFGVGLSWGGAIMTW